MRKWRELYDKLPPDRRAVIEARVEGELARLNNNGPQVVPYKPGPLSSAWMEGWGDADQVILATNLLKEEHRHSENGASEVELRNCIADLEARLAERIKEMQDLRMCYDELQRNYTRSYNEYNDRQKSLVAELAEARAALSAANQDRDSYRRLTKLLDSEKKAERDMRIAAQDDVSTLTRQLAEAQVAAFNEGVEAVVAELKDDLEFPCRETKNGTPCHICDWEYRVIKAAENLKRPPVSEGPRAPITEHHIVCAQHGEQCGEASRLLEESAELEALRMHPEQAEGLGEEGK